MLVLECAPPCLVLTGVWAILDSLPYHTRTATLTNYIAGDDEEQMTLLEKLRAATHMHHVVALAATMHKELFPSLKVRSLTALLSAPAY